MRDTLLTLSVSEAEYAAWKAARQARRRTVLPVPAFVRVEGFSSGDASLLGSQLAHHVGTPFDMDEMERELEALSGLDRYESITWRFDGNPAGESGLLVEARPKSYGPPFLMLGLNLENTTSDAFRLTLTARYLGYDLVGAGSELRVDATIGSDPSLAAELYKPIGSSPLFVAPYAGISNRTFNLIQNDAIVASYGQTLSEIGLNVGINLSRQSDLRIGGFVGRLTANVTVGDPGLPAVDGKETVAEANWRYNSQDSPVVPSVGSAAYTNIRYLFDGPDITPPLTSDRSSVGLTQLSGESNTFWSVRQKDRLFLLGGGGTSFKDRPLPTDQFTLGSPMHLGAYSNGEIRGDNYYVLTGGYLFQLGRMPDFLGGAIYGGGWLENGDAFDTWSSAKLRTNVSGGVIMDTLIGPVMVAVSAGFDGRWRTYLGIGRLFGGKK
jgi:NTE family protein